MASCSHLAAILQAAVRSLYRPCLHTTPCTSTMPAACVTSATSPWPLARSRAAPETHQAPEHLAEHVRAPSGCCMGLCLWCVMSAGSLCCRSRRLRVRLLVHAERSHPSAPSRRARTSPRALVRALCKMVLHGMSMSDLRRSERDFLSGTVGSLGGRARLRWQGDRSCAARGSAPLSGRSRARDANTPASSMKRCVNCTSAGSCFGARGPFLSDNMRIFRHACTCTVPGGSADTPKPAV